MGKSSSNPVSFSSSVLVALAVALLVISVHAFAQGTAPRRPTLDQEIGASLSASGAWSASIEVEPGQAVYFKALRSRAAASRTYRKWDFGDEAKPTRWLRGNRVVKHEYVQAGTYTVTCTRYDRTRVDLGAALSPAGTMTVTVTTSSGSWEPPVPAYPGGRVVSADPYSSHVQAYVGDMIFFGAFKDYNLQSLATCDFDTSPGGRPQPDDLYCKWSFADGTPDTVWITIPDYGWLVPHTFKQPGNYIVTCYADDNLPEQPHPDPVYDDPLQTRTMTVQVVQYVPEIRYVDVKTGSDSKSGLSWSRAKRTVGAALADCRATDEVWVRGFTQEERDADAVGTAYKEAVALVPAVGVYGGFAGNEVARDQRDWATYITVIDPSLAAVESPCVTVPEYAQRDTVLDGFTLTHSDPAYQERGIYGSQCCPTISHNMVTGNAISGPGAGMYFVLSVPNINNNVVSYNTATSRGCGIALYGCALHMVVQNNTIVYNTGTDEEAISFYYCYTGIRNPRYVENNIVAFNSSGIHGTVYEWAGMKWPRFYFNCVWNPDGDNWCGELTGPYYDTPNYEEDPHLAADGIHIAPVPPCYNGGALWQTQEPESDKDIDCQPRIQDGTIDVGADESNGFNWYSLDITADPNPCEVGEWSEVTITLYDPAAQAGVPNHLIDPITVLNAHDWYFVTAGGVKDDDTTGHCNTDANGDVQLMVTRTAPGVVKVTAHTVAPDDTELTNSINVLFRDSANPNPLVFCVDTSGSMDCTVIEGIRDAVNEMAPYLTYIGGIKFCEEILDIWPLSTDIPGFIAWLEDTSFTGGGGGEVQLEALWEAADMVPGGYIGLATDEPWDTYSPLPHSRDEVIAKLEANGCCVYIDPTASLAAHYAPLAVNGSIEEELGYYTFPLLQAVITGGAASPPPALLAPNPSVRDPRIYHRRPPHVGRNELPPRRGRRWRP